MPSRVKQVQVCTQYDETGKMARDLARARHQRSIVIGEDAQLLPFLAANAFGLKILPTRRFSITC